MKHIRIVALAVLALTAARSRGDEESPDPLAGWTFHNGREFPGATGQIVWNPREGRGSPGCVEVRYSFAKGGNYVAAMTRPPEGSDPRRVRLWLHKPADNRITFRASDSAGQTFQKSIHYEYPGWQQIEVDLSTWVHSWGGPADGRVRWPITAFGVLIENDGRARTGQYFIDDIEWHAEPPGGPAPDGPRRSTYMATDFRDESWRMQGPSGCAFEAGTWTYDLPADGTASIASAFSLLGSPQRMRLRVESDGSGNELHLALHSHFQTFETSVGTLDGTGERAFEVELGKLAGWRHYGGENDGIARLPLRVGRISLTRRGGVGRGRIRLLGMDVETEYPPERRVVLIPDGRIAGHEARFEVVVRNLAADPVAGTLLWEVRDPVGRLAERRVELTLPGGARRVRHEFRFPLAGRRFVEGAFRFLWDGGISPEASVTLVREPDTVESSPDSSPIGVGIYLYRSQGMPNRIEHMRRLCSLAQRAGVKWTREEFQWHVTQPQPDRFEWSFYDDLVRVAGEHNIRVYGLLAYWSGWTRPYTREGVHDYARWAAQVVRRYKDRIRHWEVWNEPNIFFWSGPKELYTEALKEAYAAIKSEDPQAQVLGCSTAGIDTSFIRKVIEGGAPFDILTIHPYRAGLNENAFIDELRSVSRLVEDRPVWITEMGWSSHIGGFTEREQAGYVARTYLSALASGVVGSVSWYDFRDDGDDPFYNEDRFGLIRHDFRPKAGYMALATIGRLLARHKAAGTVDVGDDLLGFRFAAPDQDVVALLSPEVDAAVALTCRPAGVRAFDAMGEPLAIDASGRFVGALPKGWPIYLVGPSGLRCAREPMPVRVVVDPSFVRPGQTVTFRITAAAPWSLVRWQWPAGWPVATDTGPGTWVVSVPATEPQGVVPVIAEFRAGEPAGTDAAPCLRVPTRVTVQPSLLRT